VVAGIVELERLGGALGLFRRERAPVGPPAEVEALMAERARARQQRDFKRADELRRAIHTMGWQVEDTPAGPRLTRRTT
jgi:cysteinyl-tRNA synthetase